MSYPYAEQVKQIFDIPRDASQVHEVDWHRTAADLFLPADENGVRSLARTATAIVTAFPYETLDPMLEALPDPERLTELRFYRKVLLIGRDVLNLTGADLIEDPATEPFRSLVTTMGRIADRGGRKPKPIRRAQEQAASAPASVQHLTERTTVHPRTLYFRTRDSLQTPLLVKQSPQLIDEAAYHHARRSFRAVVHLGIVSQLISPSQEKLQQIMDGVELSAAYGSVHNNLVKQQRAAKRAAQAA